MNLKKIFIGAATVTMIVLLASSVLSAGVHFSGLPKVDEILFKAYLGATPEAIVDEFLMHETEWIEGPYRKDLYDQVIAAGHKVSPIDPMSEFDFIAINCRDYKETAGTPNFPLNDSNFRGALSYIYGMDDKMNDIYAYVQAAWTWALGNVVPPAQEPWYDNAVTMPDTDWVTAWFILQTHGYEVNVTDNWVWCNGTKLRDMDVLYPTGDLFWEHGPGIGLAIAFNSFIAYIGAIGPSVIASPEDFGTLVSDLLLVHDYDFICTRQTDLGIYVDWLYDMLHSDNIGYWGRNICGIVDPVFDAQTEIILTSLSEAAIITAASIVQNRFIYQIMPWFPVSTGTAFCSSWRSGSDELMNVISMPNYGPMNDWSWMAMHWNSSWPGGTVKRALRDTPHTLSPYTEETPYGWQMLDRTMSSLLMRRPDDLTLMPFVSTNWTLAEWVSIPELGITDGATATFYIRQDVTWHDGYPVTADDCVNNLRVMREYQPGRYSRVWANLAYEEADGPYKFNVYFYTTSLYCATYVAETALLAPKHVIEAVEGWVDDGYLTDFFDWDPAYTDYDDATMSLGTPPVAYPFMKQIVGCGPYVFDYYDKSLAVGRVQKYEDFFVSAPAIGGAVGEWRVHPYTNYTYTALVQNVAAKEDSADGELTSITVDVAMYEDDVWIRNVTGITLEPWEWQYLGPYTTNTLNVGEHTIKIEVYGSDLIHTYTHRFVATIKEDVNFDFKVDGQDLMFVIPKFGSYPGHERWDPKADFVKDFSINILEKLRLERRFGWEGEPVWEDPPPSQQEHFVNLTVVPNATISTDFSANITVLNVTDLIACEFRLYYNTNALDLVSISVAHPMNWSLEYSKIEDDYSATLGRCHVVVERNSSLPPFNGSTTLAVLTLEGVTEGAASILDLTNTVLADKNVAPIPHNATDAQIWVGVCDLSIINLDFSITMCPFAHRTTVFAYVTVRNKGTFEQTFDINIDYANSLIRTRTITLASGASTTMEFHWTATEFGDLEIKVYTDMIPDDINPTDNTIAIYIYVPYPESAGGNESPPMFTTH